jgi:hypothetical protein
MQLSNRLYSLIFVITVIASAREYILAIYHSCKLTKLAGTENFVINFFKTIAKSVKQRNGANVLKFDTFRQRHVISCKHFTLAACFAFGLNSFRGRPCSLFLKRALFQFEFKSSGPLQALRAYSFRLKSSFLSLRDCLF